MYIKQFSIIRQLYLEYKIINLCWSIKYFSLFLYCLNNTTQTHTCTSRGEIHGNTLLLFNVVVAKSNIPHNPPWFWPVDFTKSVLFWHLVIPCANPQNTLYWAISIPSHVKVALCCRWWHRALKQSLPPPKPRLIRGHVGFSVCCHDTRGPRQRYSSARRLQRGGGEASMKSSMLSLLREMQVRKRCHAPLFRYTLFPRCVHCWK